MSKQYTNENVAPQGRWLGEPVRPETLFNEQLTVGEEEDMKYRLRVENERSPMNVTPFLEDISVLYVTRQ